MLCIFKKSMSMLTFTSHFNISGIYEGMRSRYVLNFWNGNLYHPTNFNSLLVFTAASIPYFVKKNKTAIERVWLILVATIMLIAALSTSTRTNLFVLIVVFFLMHFSVIQIFKVNDIRIHRDRLLHFSIFYDNCHVYSRDCIILL